ncbi:uncharacterized protein LOC126815244 [Patella vulgata]|uniref:uncharacterized protein LOC126815244 n=1 Tax=Patella vulgata TaxID=6465 RepID=UPI0024A893D3|nr:uncharacterized protein LOC126815244 [Patella vulgata]
MCAKKDPPRLEDFELLVEDRTFTDYFNVYLSLPVFGQRVIYDVIERDFEFCPSVRRQRDFVHRKRLLQWLYTERYSLFCNTDLYLEYLLCLSMDDPDASKNFIRNLLGHVMGMQLLREALKGTHGEKVYQCWLDAKKIHRIASVEDKRYEINRFKQTYLISGADKELAENYKEVVYHGSSFVFLFFFSIFTQCFGWGFYNFFETLLLRALTRYWLPRYIIHIINSLPTPKLQAAATTTQEEDKDGQTTITDLLSLCGGRVVAPLEIRVSDKVLCGIASDHLAGFPFRKFLRSKGLSLENRCLSFWNDVHYYNQLEQENVLFIKQKFAQRIVERYLLSNDEENEIFCESLKLALIKSLSEENDESLLYAANDLVSKWLKNLVHPQKVKIEAMKVSKKVEMLVDEEELNDALELEGISSLKGRDGRLLRRHGTMLVQPTKPRSFMEVLSTREHFEFFRLYLINEKALQPLLFWKCVEDMKRTMQPQTCQLKANQIFRRFFGRHANHGEALDSKDDIIKMLSSVSKASPGMLLCAQSCIFRMMERKWYPGYLESFPANAEIKDIHTSDATAPNDTRIILNNKVISLTKLPRDLHFWLEVTRDQYQGFDYAKGGITKEDMDLLTEKSKAIVNCFLASDIAPRVQVNVTSDMAVTIANNLHLYGPQRSLFHEASILLFPVLYHFWRRFCDEWLKNDTAERYMRKHEHSFKHRVVHTPHTDSRPPDYQNVDSDNIKTFTFSTTDDTWFRINFTILNGIRILLPKLRGSKSGEFDEVEDENVPLKSKSAGRRSVVSIRSRPSVSDYKKQSGDSSRHKGKEDGRLPTKQQSAIEEDAFLPAGSIISETSSSKNDRRRSSNKTKDMVKAVQVAIKIKH